MTSLEYLPHAIGLTAISAVIVAAMIGLRRAGDIWEEVAYVLAGATAVLWAGMALLPMLYMSAVEVTELLIGLGGG